MIRQAGANNANCSIGHFPLGAPLSLLLERLESCGGRRGRTTYKLTVRVWCSLKGCATPQAPSLCSLPTLLHVSHQQWGLIWLMGPGRRQTDSTPSSPSYESIQAPHGTCWERSARGPVIQLRGLVGLRRRGSPEALSELTIREKAHYLWAIPIPHSMRVQGICASISQTSPHSHPK